MWHYLTWIRIGWHNKTVMRCQIMQHGITLTRHGIMTWRKMALEKHSIGWHNLTTRKDTTIAPLGKSASLAPGLVRPRHITFAPLRRNLIAPLSTCWHGKITGSRKNKTHCYCKNLVCTPTLKRNFQDCHSWTRQKHHNAVSRRHQNVASLLPLIFILRNKSEYSCERPAWLLI